MFENPRRGRQARNFTTNVSKILDLKSFSEQIFSKSCRWVPLNLQQPSHSNYWCLREMMFSLSGDNGFVNCKCLERSNNIKYLFHFS